MRKTDPVAAKLLDDLIVLFNLHRADNEVFNTYCDAIEYIKRAAREHPEQPVTMSLARKFDETDPGWRDARRATRV